MRVQIDDPEFSQTLKELAAATGEPEGVLLQVAVKERLERVQHRKQGAVMERIRPDLDRVATPPEFDPELAKPTADEIVQLIRSFPSGPVRHDVSDDEILGYGPNGYSE